MANEKATLYIAMKLPIGRWTVKSLPRKPADFQPRSHFRLFWYSADRSSHRMLAAWAAQVHKETELERSQSARSRSQKEPVVDLNWLTL